MTNYYEILGLSYGAGIAEIKASFRQLAKRYHPDKNPEGLEHFTRILKAYETLSDPALKASYDYKLNYHQSQVQQQARTAAAKKTWKADERELKRRQYYNEHIKKHAKKSPDRTTAEPSPKEHYNEFRYILFATPLAVILFLLIMNLASRDRKEFSRDQNPASVSPPPEKKESFAPLKPGDAPYNEIFGPPKYYPANTRAFVVKNLSGMEMILCLFTAGEFIRCFYMGPDLSAEVSQLPEEPLYIYYCTGREFDPDRVLDGGRVRGAFSRHLAFYRSSAPGMLNTGQSLSLFGGINEGFEAIDEAGFFNYATQRNNHDTEN